MSEVGTAPPHDLYIPYVLVENTVVDYHEADNGSERSGIKVEGAMKVLPCGHFCCNGGLAQDIEREFGLGEELILEKVRERVRYS